MRVNIASTPNLSDLASWLQNKGWQELPPSAAVLNYCDRLWQKKTDCLFLNLYTYKSDQINTGLIKEEPHSFAIELAAQSNDGYWTRYEKYGIRGSELKDVLDDQIGKLVKAWEAID